LQTSTMMKMSSPRIESPIIPFASPVAEAGDGGGDDEAVAVIAVKKHLLMFLMQFAVLSPGDEVLIYLLSEIAQQLASGIRPSRPTGIES
jgi:hypothetical protein